MDLTIRGYVAFLHNRSLSEVVACYNAAGPSNSSFSSSYSSVPLLTATSNAEAISAMNNGSIDFAIVDTPLSSLQQTSMPDVAYYPLLVLPIVVVYNLFGGSVPCGTASCINLTLPGLCQLFSGSISSWQDAQLTSINSGLPAAPVNVAVSNSSEDAATLTLIQLCTVEDSGASWAAVGSLGSSSQWGNLQGARRVLDDSSKVATAQWIASTPNSVSYMYQSQAEAFGLAYATLVNSHGVAQAATLAAVQAGSSEKLLDYQAVPAPYIDLSNAGNGLAYPLLGAAYLLLPKLYTRVICSLRLATLNFVQYTLSSPAAAASLSAHFTPIVDGLSQQYINISGQLSSGGVCDGTFVLKLNSEGVVAGAPLASPLFSYLLSFYQQVSSALLYSFAPAPSAETLSLLSSYNELQYNGTTDVAVVSPADWSTGSSNATLDSSVASLLGLTLLPAYLAGVVPIFSLPAAVVDTASQPAYANLTALYPLVIDVDTLAGIFLGQIRSWTDVAIAARNPSLASRFQATRANTTITAVICCSSAADPLAATNSLSASFSQLSPRWQTAYPSGNQPVDWTTLLARTLYGNQSTSASLLKTASLTVAVNERQVPLLVQSAAGSVGYAAISGAQVDDTNSFRVLLPKYAHIRVATQNAAMGSPQGMAACIAADSLSLQQSVLDLTAPSLPSRCWPLTQLLSLALPSAYTDSSVYGPLSSLRTDRCLRAATNVPMVQSFLTEPSLTAGLLSRGVWPLQLSDSAQLAYQESVSGQLNAITCDGDSILGYTTVQWALSSSISQAGTSLAVVCMLLCLATIPLLIVYRQQPVFRSSSVAMLLVIVCGLLCLLAAAIPFVQPSASELSCSFALWAAVLGFTLTFAPLFLKMWRIWCIFERKQLTVVRITDRSLLAVVALLVAADLVVLAVWQARAPIEVGLSTVPTGGSGRTVMEYQQCSIPSAALPFVLLEVCSKGCLVLFGALMAFSARRVEGLFSESQSVGWSIYNVVFTLTILVAVGASAGSSGGSGTGLHGDEQVLLVLCGVLWVPLFTWLCVFSPKLQLLYYSLMHPEKAKLVFKRSGAAVAGNNSRSDPKKNR